MTRLAVPIQEPPEGGAFVLLTLLDIAAHHAPLVEVVVRQNLHCHRVTYQGSPCSSSGNWCFRTPPTPELFILGQAIWDVLEQHYCETVLVLSPQEPGERVFTLECDSYEAYLKDTMRFRLEERLDELRQVRLEEAVTAADRD